MNLDSAISVLEKCKYKILMDIEDLKQDNLYEINNFNTRTEKERAEDADAYHTRVKIMKDTALSLQKAIDKLKADE